MTNMLRARQIRPCLALVGLAVVALSAFGQTPGEHESHHPSPTAESPALQPMPDQAPQDAGSAPARSAQGMMERMGADHMDMGGGRRKELYPSLMELAEITPEVRAELEQLARERMNSGMALMSSGVEKLAAATSPRSLPRMQEALAQMRQGIEQFESGTAALSAVSDGKPPRTAAIEWFRSSMSLPAADVERPHGIFGLSAFHYFTMVAVFGAALALVWMNIRKMQRSQALVARLSGAGEAGVLPQTPSAAAPTPPSFSTEQVPSKPNSWTGLLRVVRIFEETPNVRTLRLANPDGDEVPFRHLPGQFVTFTVRPIDQAVKRSYTIASPPTRRDYLEVTVKREEYGTVSSFLHAVHEGDTLQATGPSGNFTFAGEGANSIVLISGGVGITPMMGVLRYLTDRSWSGSIYFVYGCKSDKDVIYREELEYLKRRYPNLTLAIAAEEAPSDWPHARGQITKELLTEAVPHIQTRRIHLCGPPGMMRALKATLAELGIPPDQIRAEVFIGRERPEKAAPQTAVPQGPVEVAVAAASAASAQTREVARAPGLAVITFARSRQTAMLPPTKTILEASEDVGVNIEYSCRVGVCGVCKVKLLSGSVTMEVQEGLDAQDKQKNVILACQAKSSGDVSVDA
ncbi:MAG TPA: 2Fe-2S iron-sulfur cluster-binding protein [Steroidobacteraceae bacterium]|nr:2Fe-2S iron-sulfur cluster-binding protein [Steroidobacteraceae bacterium]